MGEPLRILFLATAWRGLGGVNTINRGLAIAVAALEDELLCSVWCGLPNEPDRDDRAEMESAGVQPLVAKSLVLQASTERLLSLDLAKYNFDIIVGHGRWSGEAAYELAERYGVSKVAYFVHVDPEIEYGKNRDTAPEKRYSEKRASDGRLHRKAYVAFGVGPKLCSAFPGRTVQILPGFIPKSYLRPAKKQALLIGRLEDALKGADIGMSAMALLTESFPGLELEVRGAKKHSSELEVEAEALVKKHFDVDTADLAIRSTPFVTDSIQIADSFEHASVVLMPSVFEGFGLVALEGLEYGRPVVASSRSGFAILLQELLPPETSEKFIIHTPAKAMETGDRKWKEVVESLCAKVEWFLRNEDETQQLVSDVQEALRSKCDPGKNAQTFVETLHLADHKQETTVGALVRQTTTSSSPSTTSERRPATASPDDLRSWPMTILGEWLERPEEEVLLTRIETGEPLTLLTGGPGLGKSALMRSVTQRLEQKEWTVVAVKADLMPPTYQGERWGMEELDRYLGHDGDTLSVC